MKDANKSKKLSIPRLAQIFSIVAGAAGLYTSFLAVTDPQTAFSSILGEAFEGADSITRSWAVRNFAISAMLLFAAFLKRPMLLFAAMATRLLTDIGDLYVGIQGSADASAMIPVAVLVVFELYVLFSLRKQLRI